MQALGGRARPRPCFILAVALWLWFTVLFANFAEALAEGRSKAQAASLRGLKQTDLGQEARSEPRRRDAQTWHPLRAELRKRRRRADRGRRLRSPPTAR